MKSTGIPIKAVKCCAWLLGVLCLSGCVRSSANDEPEIRALEQRLVDGVKAKDIDRIMSCYDDSLFAFDVIHPRQYVGAKAYRKDYEDFLAAFPGPVDVDSSDLNITVGGDMAYGHLIFHFGGTDTNNLLFATDKDSKRFDETLRVTHVYRKVGAKWGIVHEHVSVPVDYVTGKADLTSKP